MQFVVAAELLFGGWFVHMGQYENGARLRAAVWFFTQIKLNDQGVLTTFATVEGNIMCSYQLEAWPLEGDSLKGVYVVDEEVWNVQLLLSGVVLRMSGARAQISDCDRSVVGDAHPHIPESLPSVQHHGRYVKHPGTAVVTRLCAYRRCGHAYHRGDG
ncbi:MAG: hypothetical protein KKB08_05120 [Gammaproteobacteria bacterium]|nr:hypothetical protein [Gammaproteobacteria bacterium]